MPTVPQALRTTRIPVYVSDTVVQYLKDAVWVENPGALFGRLLGETISARTGRVVLDPSQYSHDPGTRLTGQLQRFGLDPNAMEVVVVYDAAIAARRTGGVATNRFEARVPVADATAAAVAPALNQAANQVAEQVAAWIGAARSARLFETCSNTSLLRPGVATIRSSSARIRAARSSPKRRQRPSGGTSFAAFCGLSLSTARIDVGEEAVAVARGVRGARAGWRRTRRSASAAGSDCQA